MLKRYFVVVNRIISYTDCILNGLGWKTIILLIMLMVNFSLTSIIGVGAGDGV